MKKIVLTQGYYALVDDEDYNKLSVYKWHSAKRRDKVYAERTGGGQGNKKTISMHREITKAPKGAEVDHINHRGLDNRKVNLRICTKSQNQMNSKKVRGVSKYKGVTWDKHAKKWKSQIREKGKIVCLGYFDIEHEASVVYEQRAKLLHGYYYYKKAV